MTKYPLSAFRTVPGVSPTTFYCPGCNASADDVAIRPVTCPCATHGSKSGSLSSHQVSAYLVAVAA